LRLGKHQVQVLLRDIVRRARDQSCCVQPLPGGHVEIAERGQPCLCLVGRGANSRIVPEQYVPVDGTLAGVWFCPAVPAVSCLVRYRHHGFSLLGILYLARHPPCIARAAHPVRELPRHRCTEAVPDVA
jgi:hypothetical protein